MDSMNKHKIKIKLKKWTLNKRQNTKWRLVKPHDKMETRRRREKKSIILQLDSKIVTWLLGNSYTIRTCLKLVNSLLQSEEYEDLKYVRQILKSINYGYLVSHEQCKEKLITHIFLIENLLCKINGRSQKVLINSLIKLINAAKKSNQELYLFFIQSHGLVLVIERFIFLYKRNLQECPSYILFFYSFILSQHVNYALIEHFIKLSKYLIISLNHDNPTTQLTNLLRSMLASDYKKHFQTNIIEDLIEFKDISESEDFRFKCEFLENKCIENLKYIS